MAKKAPAGASSAGIKVRVLTAGTYGGQKAEVNDVLELSEEDVARHVAESVVDPHPDAVAYAESLKG
jgi:hypothetical protein